MKSQKIYIISSIIFTTILVGGLLVYQKIMSDQQISASIETAKDTQNFNLDNALKSLEADRDQIKLAGIKLASLNPRKIVIDLSEQRLYCYEGEDVVKTFLVSTGLTASTPTGTFHIYSRSRSCLMEGPGYYLPGVEWVNRFNGHISIHGTYWHHNFGHPMSHGCVNATNEDARFVYFWAPMGTEVNVQT